ncbi:MAG: YihY/virulence factor BrkB family protein [Pseudomonadota bacterium]|uniref:YihY/virulence factor BrkB family protein n=1 Tax=Polaromonas sp. TaxID=1869339 RepID=UPI0017F47AAB|nr:YihY/virulence factor BrkB family protein [Polaromonas sp.]MBA3592869.1 YihY/virulence factor BrkB family protein [Polaromonas sp.]MDQ3271815.1 YihY/virulence factor BrkB family protein [Pseudomonadota bacterium]
MHFQLFYRLARQSVTAWIDDYAPSMGAAISYYTVFSIAPLLIIVIAVAGMLWGRDAVQGEIVAQLTGLIGKDGAIGVQALIESANKPAKGVFATLISVAVLVVGATTVFAELQSALDRVWDVPPSQKASGIWATLRARLLSLGFILGLGFLLSVSLVFSAGVAAFGGWANGLFPGWEVLLQVVNTAISLGVSSLLFAMIFKLMPQASVSWRDVWVGAAVTAVLFEIGKTLIGLYIGKSSVTSSFAAAGSLVVLLLWVYYSAQIFLLGAEFTWVFAHEHGSLKGQVGHKETPVAGSDADGGSVLAPAVAAPHRSDAGGKEIPAVPQDALPAPAHRPVASALRPATSTLRQRALVYGVSSAGLALLALVLQKKFGSAGRRPR